MTCENIFHFLSFVIVAKNFGSGYLISLGIFLFKFLICKLNFLVSVEQILEIFSSLPYVDLKSNFFLR